MPPKVKFSKADLIKAAIEIVERGGLKDLTARNVATKLDSSTAPVYKHFSAMDELALEVIRKIQQELLDYTSRPYTEAVFLNMGTGIAMFACEHPQLYRALMLEGDNYGNVVTEFLEILERALTKDQRLVMLSDDERRILLHKMWTFTHGLATLTCVGLKHNCTQEKIVKTLMGMGADVIGATLARHKDNSENIN